MTSRGLIAFADARVPRYTSYPTATQFGPLDEATYRGWLRAAVRPADTLSLYVHVPFCRNLCWYCGCLTRPTRSEPRIDTYAEALLMEAALLSASLPSHAGISHLHLGGGTPSILGPERLRTLMQRLHAAFGFHPDAEIAIELDPRYVSDELAATLAAIGVTRVSLGVQDITPEVQAAIGRIQPAAQVAEAVARLRRAGMASINLDLMYGLPRQTAAHVETTARFAAGLKPARVAVFGYAHVPWMRTHQKAIDAAALPGAEARLEQAECAERVLCAEGYQALGLDHFARPDDPLAGAARAGTLRRNFQGYTTDRAGVLLGLGASSIGTLPSGFAQNDTREAEYRTAVLAGRLPVVRGCAVTAEDRLRAGMIERLMCDFALDLDALAQSGAEAAAIVAEARERFAPLQRDGLVAVRDGWLRVTPEGRRFVRQAAACFDAYLHPGGGVPRHAVAV